MLRGLKYLFIGFLVVGGLRLLFDMGLHAGVNQVSQGMTGRDYLAPQPYSIHDEVHDFRMECNIRGQAWCNKWAAQSLDDIYHRAIDSGEDKDQAKKELVREAQLYGFNVK